MKMNVNVKVKQNFRGAQRATVADMASALYMIAEEIMTDSKTNYVPVLRGFLRNSGYVEQPVIAGTKITVTLGFGGVAAPYALKVHESPKSWGQGKNKYLSKPVNAMKPLAPTKMADYMKARISSRPVI